LTISPGDWAKSHLGYEFSDQQLLQQALTHRSASALHNERLEFLGDAVLGAVVAKAVFDLKPDDNEGALSRFRSQLVRRSTLAVLARELGLAERIRLGSGERASGSHQRESVLANALEAVFGAVFLDGGYEAARELIDRLFADRLQNMPSEAALKDAKTRLQEWLQARNLPPPEYELMTVSGAAHRQLFQVACRIEAFDLETSGDGTSRRRAEQAAANLAFEQLPDGQ
jgi:ribonuclease-3